MTGPFLYINRYFHGSSDFLHSYSQFLFDPINDDFSPEVLVLDPWNGITGDDSQRDYRSALDNFREAVPKGDEEPAILIVAHN